MDDQDRRSQRLQQIFVRRIGVKMFEVRKSGKTYRVYDKTRKKYICNTKDKDRADNYAQNVLYNSGFEGNIPDFMLYGLKYGVPLDKGK